MKILIATDGSDFSNAAIETCCKFIGKPDETEIKVVSIYEAPAAMAAEPFAVTGEAYQELVDIAEEQANEAARKASETIKKQFPNLKSLSTRVELERPATGVIEIADEWKPDLIVVGSHGHGFWGRALLGSVSDGVVHHAPCSVLVVRKP